MTDPAAHPFVRDDKDRDVPPEDAKRIKSFARFFKSYMSVSAILVAALPIPVTSFKLLPVFEAQQKILSVYTPLFCFLLISYVFFCRHSFARWMFPVRKSTTERRIASILPFLPLALILATGLSIISYHLTLNS